MGCVWGMPSLSSLSSLGDRYNLRMPKYGCADKLPSQSSFAKVGRKKQQQQQQKRIIILITMTKVMSYYDDDDDGIERL